MDIYVFKTTLRGYTDIKAIAPFMDAEKRIECWTVDLEDCDKVLRVESKELAAKDISDILNGQGYVCKELGYLPEEVVKTKCRVWGTLLLLLFPLYLLAQTTEDSLANDFRTFAAKNISRYRTLNLSYETKWAHDYTFTLNGNEVEKGRKKNLHTLRFSAMVPLLKLRNVSLYANLQGSHYLFDHYGDGNISSQIFSDDSYNYYYGGFNGSYYMKLFNRPLILSAEVAIDGWDKGWGKLQGRFSAIMVVKNTAQTKFSAGLAGMTLFSSIPVMPVITYWHQFANPNLSVDITMPSQFYLRYQMKSQRISAGASMSADSYYLKSSIGGAPTTYYYSDAVLKPEIHYEYIINRYFYLSAHAGLAMVMKGGLYTKNRKGVKEKNSNGKSKIAPVVKQAHSPVPFFNVGVSYSLFK